MYFYENDVGPHSYKILAGQTVGIFAGDPLAKIKTAGKRFARKMRGIKSVETEDVQTEITGWYKKTMAGNILQLVMFDCDSCAVASPD